MNQYIAGFSCGIIVASVIISVLGFYVGRKSSKKLKVWEKANEDAQRDALNKAYAKGVKDCSEVMQRQIELIGKAQKRVIVKIINYSIVNGDELPRGVTLATSKVPVVHLKEGRVGEAGIITREDGIYAEIVFESEPRFYHNGYPLAVGQVKRNKEKHLITYFRIDEIWLRDEPCPDKSILTIGEQLANQKEDC